MPVIQSLSLARRQQQALDQRLQAATAEIQALTPPVGRGHRQYREEAALATAVQEVLTRQRVHGLLTVTWERQETRRRQYVGRGRGSSRRSQKEIVTVRYQITGVQPCTEALAAQRERLGWRVQVSNLSKRRCSFAEAVRIYHGGWSLERDFHLLKDKPLGIQPLFVRTDEQISGLTRLLTIALRVLTLFEMQVRRGLAEAKEALAGLYEGQPQRTTARPTAGRLLRAISRMDLTLTKVEVPGHTQWQLTPLPPLLKRILKLAGLSSRLYTKLQKDAVGKPTKPQNDSG